MGIKKWKITAELNMDSSNFSSCIVEANGKNKAITMAEKYFTKKMKATNINIKSIERIDDDDI